ncbi:MAG: thioredoxin [Candidatus Thermoplasmatota archaeon]|nr:thioredoxin [Candidatus Thermoplasmatota archaeon]
MDETRKINEKMASEMIARGATVELKTAKSAHLDDANFGQFVKNNGLAVVDFYAEWCGPCKMLAPVIDELAKELAGKVSFGKVNVDECGVASDFSIMGVPTMMIFKNGKAVDQIVGYAPKEAIKAKLSRHY